MADSTVNPRFCAFLVSALVLGAATAAQAEQFVLTDVTYTHAADNTKDSHYRLSPLGPKNWKTPVDYSGGSLHTRLEVKTKPDAVTQTYFQVCLEATPGAACAYLSPIYTKTGVYEWDTPFDKFWYSSTVDWTKGIKQVALIIKDSKLGKPQGDAKFVPTQLSVQVTINSPGTKYVPPGKGSADAGVVDASVLSPSSDAAVAADAAAPAPPDSVEQPVRDASTSATLRDAAVAAGRGDAGGDALDDDVDPATSADGDDSGCSAHGGASAGAWLCLLSTLAFVVRRRRA